MYTTPLPVTPVAGCYSRWDGHQAALQAPGGYAVTLLHHVARFGPGHRDAHRLNQSTGTTLGIVQSKTETSPHGLVKSSVYADRTGGLSGTPIL